MSKRRVVITGLGTINPLANNVSDTWNSLINGESGIDAITAFDTTELPVSFAGEVKNFDANEYMGKQQARKLDKSSQLSIFATEEALKDANLNTDERLGSNVVLFLERVLVGLVLQNKQLELLMKEGLQE